MGGGDQPPLRTARCVRSLVYDGLSHEHVRLLPFPSAEAQTSGSPPLNGGERRIDRRSREVEASGCEWVREGVREGERCMGV